MLIIFIADNWTFSRPKNLSEELLYQFTLCYLYIFSLLKKYYSFDLDLAMRTKLFWEIHNLSNSSDIRKWPCSCIYSIDAEFIIKALLKKLTRQTVGQKFIERYYSNDKNSMVYILKHCKEDFVSKSMSKVYQDEEVTKLINWFIQNQGTNITNINFLFKI